MGLAARSASFTARTSLVAFTRIVNTPAAVSVARTSRFGLRASAALAQETSGLTSALTVATGAAALALESVTAGAGAPVMPGRSQALNPISASSTDQRTL